jgi:hypothetical protein
MVAIQSEVSNPWFATWLRRSRERSHGLMIAKTDSRVPHRIGIRRHFLAVTRSSKHNFALFFYKKDIYSKMIYLYFYENIFQDKSIDMIFTFSNSIT